MTDSLRADLVTANHVLANEGILGGVGHVSVRDPDADAMFISRSRSPAFVAESDVIRMAFDGTVLDGSDARPYKETVIHRAIYRARDDVNAVVHHHAPSVIPYTVTDVEVRPVFHMAAIFGDGVPTFEDYDAEFGRLIVTEAEGDRMAAVLGDHRAQLLAGHGSNVVGAGLEEAVLSTLALVMNCQYQFQAELLGGVQYFDDAEALSTTVEEAVLAPMVVERLWEYYSRRLPERD